MTKAIKNGLIYDSEKSELIAHYSYGHGGDFQQEYTELRVTDNKRFFLYGSGGPMSRWAKKVSQGMTSGSSDQIQPIDAHEAAAYAEQWGCDVETYIQYFDWQEA